jgi:hypothetical protein
LVDRNAAAGDGAPMSRESVDALAAAGLFGVMTPREAGGAEVPLLRKGALERCFRDIHAGSQHFFASPMPTAGFRP